MTFYERLTELRREKGLTQKQIVDELDLGKNSFGDWKKGLSLSVPLSNFLLNISGCRLTTLWEKLITPFLIRKR